MLHQVSQAVSLRLLLCRVGKSNNLSCFPLLFTLSVLYSLFSPLLPLSASWSPFLLFLSSLFIPALLCLVWLLLILLLLFFSFIVGETGADAGKKSTWVYIDVGGSLTACRLFIYAVSGTTFSFVYLQDRINETRGLPTQMIFPRYYLYANMLPLGANQSKLTSMPHKCVFTKMIQ